eukprot:3411621-Prymnesium_polylepis.1
MERIRGTNRRSVDHANSRSASSWRQSAKMRAHRSTSCVSHSRLTAKTRTPACSTRTVRAIPNAMPLAALDMLGTAASAEGSCAAAASSTNCTGLVRSTRCCTSDVIDSVARRLGATLSLVLSSSTPISSGSAGAAFRATTVRLLMAPSPAQSSKERSDIALAPTVRGTLKLSTPEYMRACTLRYARGSVAISCDPSRKRS